MKRAMEANRWLRVFCRVRARRLPGSEQHFAHASNSRRCLQFPLSSNLQLRHAHGLHERVRRTRCTCASSLASAYFAVRCLSGADARDNSPPKLKRTKDGNIVPPWPNKVALSPDSLDYNYIQPLNDLPLRRSFKTFSTPSPSRRPLARACPCHRCLLITAQQSATSALAVRLPCHITSTPPLAAKRPACRCPGPTRARCSCCSWPMP